MNKLELAERVEQDIAHWSDPEHVIWEKMAQRLERYERTGEQPLPRRDAMCATCPFRGANAAYRRECAMIPSQDWPCHTDHGEHCAGHHAAQARFGKPTAACLRANKDQTNDRSKENG